MFQSIHERQSDAGICSTHPIVHHRVRCALFKSQQVIVAVGSDEGLSYAVCQSRILTFVVSIANHGRDSDGNSYRGNSEDNLSSYYIIK